MKAEILPFTAEHWDTLRALLAAYWSPTHPILDRELFDWQYRGFVRDADPEACPPALLFYHRGRLLGFMGLIFGDYQVNRPAPAIVRGCALAMWLVHPEYRQAGLGLLLLRAVEERCDVVVCLGANAEAGGYYRRRGYQHCAALSRWVAPLDADGYLALCAAPANRTDVAAWTDAFESADLQTSAWIDAASLAAHWQRCTRASGGWAVQGLHRSETFWKTRYLDTVGFQYLCWGAPGDGPVLVGRVEPVADRRVRVLRLIEILPPRPDDWTGPPNPALVDTIRGVAAWAAAEGCVAVDFQVAGDLLHPHLLAAGLRRQTQPLAADPVTSLAPMFNPLSVTKPPINVYWRAPAAADVSPWYFPKSDGDMDRPHGRTADDHRHVSLRAAD